jgi:hypothetical protein
MVEPGRIESSDRSTASKKPRNQDNSYGRAIRSFSKRWRRTLSQLFLFILFSLRYGRVDRALFVFGHDVVLVLVKLARRNPDRIQRQINSFKEAEESGQQLRPRDKELLSTLFVYPVFAALRQG